MGNYQKEEVNVVLSKIESGNRVVVGGSVGEASILLSELFRNKELYENVEIVQLMTLENTPYLNEDMKKHFRYKTFFASPSTRNALIRGKADYIPCNFYKIPWVLKNKLPIDVALVHLSPPDKQGYCSFGLSVDYIKPASEAAKIVIAQINRYMPRTLGDSSIHISQISCFLEANAMIRTTAIPIYGEVEKRIAENCARLIANGSTLQIGIGKIPSVILNALVYKKDLGIHSEFISDSVMNLMKEGVITNKKKSIDNGLTVTALATGSKELYSYIHNNSKFSFRTIDYTNNPMIIMQNDNFVSINSCLEIDLMGQIVSETISGKQYSGVGGQQDFIRGVDMSKTGKSIIAIPSTAANGKISRIVGKLIGGSAVTISRNEVDYIVTEYGIAEMRGKTLRERAKALINIAHPNFRKILNSFLENSDLRY